MATAITSAGRQPMTRPISPTTVSRLASLKVGTSNPRSSSLRSGRVSNAVTRKLLTPITQLGRAGGINIADVAHGIGYDYTQPVGFNSHSDT